jgi:hypothetical protein
MAWGTAANVTTDNLDSPTDDPSLAREEIYNAFIELQAVINGRGAADGVAPLNASAKLAATYLPDTINSSVSTDLTLAPTTGRVVIQDILALQPKTVSELEGLTANQGDVSYCSDGDAGTPCIAVCLGETDSAGNAIWYKVSLGAQISAS